MQWAATLRCLANDNEMHCARKGYASLGKLHKEWLHCNGVFCFFCFTTSRVDVDAIRPCVNLFESKFRASFNGLILNPLRTTHFWDEIRVATKRIRDKGLCPEYA